MRKNLHKLAYSSETFQNTTIVINLSFQGAFLNYLEKSSLKCQFWVESNFINILEHC